MSVAAIILAKNEAGRIKHALDTVSQVCDTALVVDTGSTDNTRELARAAGATVLERPWRGFAENRTEALDLARGKADWLLMMDADMTIEAHPELKTWLAEDPDPDVNAWMTEIRDGTLSWRLPLLTRGIADARYEGSVHEYLVCPGKHRPLLGLTIHHHGVYKQGRYEQDILALEEGVAAGDPRSVYYTAQSLKCLGRTEEAAAMYERRAGMEGWEEEGWHAQFMAATLREDVSGLLTAFERRPWRHEPLTQAAAIVRNRGAQDDMLFLEQP